MNDIVISWKRYANFFDLYNIHKNEPKLIYVIGETHHCYIGSVGSKNGVNGLRMRYQSQYLERARAIFGLDKPENQPAFAGHFTNPVDPTPNVIEVTEKLIQKDFIKRHGQPLALFTLKGYVGNAKIQHTGDLPEFLK